MHIVSSGIFSSVKYRNLQKFVQDLHSDNFSTKLQQKYGSFNATINIDCFISDLQTALKERERIHLKTFDFVAISKFSLSHQQETTIYKLALKIILGAEKTLLSPKIDAVIDEVFSGPTQLPATDLQEIMNLKPCIRSYIFRAFYLIHSEDKRDPLVVHDIIALFNGIYKTSECEWIFKTLKKIPVHQRANILRSAQHLLSNDKLYNERLGILETIDKIPPVERADIILLIQPVLRQFKGHNSVDILRSIVEINALERKTIMEIAFPIIQHYNDTSLIAHIITAAWLITQKERDCGAIYSIVAELAFEENKYVREMALKVFREMPLHERSFQVLQKILPYSFNLFKDGTILIILEGFRKIPPAERSFAILLSISNIYKGIYWNHGDINEALERIPAEQRADVILKSHEILGDSRPINISFRGAVLEALSSIPSHERTPPLILKLCDLFKNTDQNNQMIFDTLVQIPEENRAKVVVESASYMKRVPNACLRAGILFAFSLQNGPEIFQKPPNHIKRIPILNQRIIAQIFQSCVDPGLRTQDQIHKLQEALSIKPFVPILIVLRIMNLLPLEQRNTKGANIFAHMILQYSRCTCTEDTIVLLLSIAPDKWDETADHISSILEAPILSITKLISELFSQEGIREASYRHLQKNLESDLPPNVKWKSAQWIINNYTHLHLYEEHPLIQYAIFIASICDPDAMKNSKNPYRIYRQIKEALEIEPTVPIVMQKEKIGGKDVIWNLSKLREKGKWTGYKGKDLPEGIAQNTLKELFVAMDLRFNKLSKQQRQAVEKYILDICELSFENLQSNMLDKPFFNELLSGITNQHDAVSPVKFQLFVVLRAILDKNDYIAEGTLLSKREDMLLKFAASAQNCVIGQRDGLANFYNALPQCYKKGPQAKESGMAAVEKSIDETVQKVMNANCSNYALLKELVREDFVNQPAHVTEYVKNRYHKQVGLRHHLLFDAHTGVLQTQLLNNTTEETLSLFFHFCTPLTAVQQLIIDSQEAFRSGLFSGMMSLIEQVEGKIEGEEDYRRYCVFEEESITPQHLTETGALDILLATSYVERM